MATVAIKSNNCATNDPCALCGKPADPAVGPALFLDGTWAAVCWQCGRRLAPDLVALLELADASRRFAMVHEDEPF